MKFSFGDSKGRISLFFCKFFIWILDDTDTESRLRIDPGGIDSDLDESERVKKIIRPTKASSSDSFNEDNQSGVNDDLPPFKILARQAKRKGIIDKKGSFHEVFSVILVMWFNSQFRELERNKTIRNPTSKSQLTYLFCQNLPSFLQ